MIVMSAPPRKSLGPSWTSLSLRFGGSSIVVA